ncbi:flagellin [Natrialbaceae archaeon A-CW2]
MGFSTSGAVAILFIGLLVAVGIVYPTLETAHDRRAGAIDERDERALELRNAAFDLETSYDAGSETVSVNVTNTGTTTLSVTEIDLLLDGVLETETATAVDDDASRERLHSGEVLEITVENVAEEPNRAKVVTEHGLARVSTDLSGDDDGE